MIETSTQLMSEHRFVRHRGPVTCVAGIPGSDCAVSSAYDGAVAYFDFGARTVELLGYHDHLVNRITVDSAGKRAASSSSDYTIKIWDLNARQAVRVLRGHSDDVEDFAFIDDHTGVSVSRDWRVLLWDLDSGAIKRVIEGHEKDVLSVVYNDGQIYTSGDDMTLRVWSSDTGELLKMWGPFDHETDSCAIDPVRGRAILGCDDGFIRVFDIATGETVAEIDAHKSGIKKVAASPANGDILSAAYDQKILVWNADDFDLKVAVEHRSTVWERSFNWSPDGRKIMAGTFDGTALLWDSMTGRCIDEIGDAGRGNICLNDVSATESGQIATVSDDGIVRFGCLTPTAARWETEVEPESGRMLANAVTLSDACDRVIAGAHNQKLHLFRRSDGRLKEEAEVAINEGPINCVRLARHAGHEGETFAACYSGAIVRIDPSGTVRGTIRVHDGAVKALRLHPERKIGISCSADGALLTWDFEGRLLERLVGHMAIVDDVDIDPTGTWAASVSRDFTMKVYRMDDGKMVQSYAIGHRSPKAVCFFEPKTVIVTTYWGALIRVDLETSKMTVRTIAENGISAIARLGHHVVAVSYDGTAYLVRSDNLNVVNTLRSMRQRLEPSALIDPSRVPARRPSTAVL